MLYEGVWLQQILENLPGLHVGVGDSELSYDDEGRDCDGVETEKGKWGVFL